MCVCVCVCVCVANIVALHKISFALVQNACYEYVLYYIHNHFLHSTPTAPMTTGSVLCTHPFWFLDNFLCNVV